MALSYLLHAEPALFDDGTIPHGSGQMLRIAAQVGSAPGIVRTAYNATAPICTVSPELADLLGLRRRRMQGAGVQGMLDTGYHGVEVLLEPLEIRLLGAGGRVLLRYTEPLVFVQPNLHCFLADLQISHLAHTACQSWGDPARFVTLRPDGLDGVAVPIPRLAPLRHPGPLAIGSTSFVVAADTLAEAARLAWARRSVVGRRQAAADAGAAAELPPLPSTLVARPWAELRSSTLGGEECCICYHVLGSQGLCVQLSCRHTYCVLCVQQWMSLHPTCPTCRTGI